MDKDEQTWLCPCCSIERVKYGTNCQRWEKGQCPNPPNVNGRWYNQNFKEKKEDTKAIGIGAISDEK